jgi:hypothetical protein
MFMITSTVPDCQSSVSTRRLPAGAPRQDCCRVGDGGGAQTQALAALAKLTASCTTAIAVIGNNPLGRYADSGSCTYSCGFKEQDWNWWCDFRQTNTNLAQDVTGSDFTGPYATAFVPAQTWVGTALPGSSTTVNENIATIMQIDAVIAASGQETPAQTSQLQAAFLNLNDAVGNNQSQMNGAVQNLAAFLNWEGGQTSVLSTAVISSRTYIGTTANKIKNDLINQIACGAGDVQNSFQNMFNDIDAKYTAMQPGFSSVTSTLQAALGACQRVAGQFLPLQADGANIRAEIDNAQQYPPSHPLRQLHLHNAQNEWQQMALHAVIELQPG